MLFHKIACLQRILFKFCGLYQLNDVHPVCSISMCTLHQNKAHFTKEFSGHFHSLEYPFMACYSLNGGICVFSVKVRPNSKATGIKGFDVDYVYVNIVAPPANNKANKELVEYFSRLFGTCKSSVNISKGATSAYKLVEVSKCLTEESVVSILTEEGYL